jgi:hypothetical protein
MKKLQTKQVYILTIKPAIKPSERHKIEDALKKLKYKVIGGGTNTDMSECEISFQKK